MRSHGVTLPDPIVVLRWHRKAVKSFVACVEVISNTSLNCQVFRFHQNIWLKQVLITLKQFYHTGRKTFIPNYFTRFTLFTGIPTRIIESTQRFGNPAGRGVKYLSFNPIYLSMLKWCRYKRYLKSLYFLIFQNRMKLP